tara:strand:+ start:884 stop:1729 length:846 start_codon:yes stop_codon:yes gene_type:complete
VSGMSQLALQAEHLKLARLLGCDEATIANMKGLDVDALRKLRDACTSMLFDGDRERLQKVVASSRLLPKALKAIVAEKALGPTLGSRVAGLLPPDEAADIAKRVSLAFNTEVTLQIDPRSAVDLLRRIPVSLVVAVTREVLKRGEYIAMARFVDALSDEQIKASMAVLDDEAMLRIGFFVESPDRLEEVVGLMSDERLQKVVSVSAQKELNLGGAVMAMLVGVSENLRARLVEAALSHPDEQVGAHLLEAGAEHDLLPMLSALRSKLSKPSASRLDALLSQ